MPPEAGQGEARQALHEVLLDAGLITQEHLDTAEQARQRMRLEQERRAVRIRLHGGERWIAADDAGLYRDAFGAVPRAVSHQARERAEVSCEPPASPLFCPCPEAADAQLL